jgi:hypothetical protein
MEDYRPANSVLSKMSVQDQRTLYSVPSVEGDTELSTDGDTVRPDAMPPSSV